MTRKRRDVQLPLRVLARIQEHTHENPIIIRVLAEEFGIDEREVKSIILELIDANHKVGSYKRKPYGVFIAKKPEEIRETAERFMAEGRKAFSRAKKLLSGWGPQMTIYENIPPDVEEALSGNTIVEPIS